MLIEDNCNKRAVILFLSTWKNLGKLFTELLYSVNIKQRTLIASGKLLTFNFYFLLFLSLMLIEDNCNKRGVILFLSTWNKFRKTVYRIIVLS